MNTEPILYFQHATIQQHEHLVLSKIDLELFPGDFTFLIGKTGSGKSSLLKTIYGDLDLKQGRGFAVGYDLTQLKKKDIPYLRRKIGIVFQDFQLLTHLNVNDNLKFVLDATGWKSKLEKDKRIEKVLEEVGMKNKGYKKTYQLSGGEQQRVVIARALLNTPELIIADEPTGNLDPNTSVEIMQLLKKLNTENNCGVLMATHDYALIRRFPSKTYRCEAGSLSLAEGQSVFI